MGARHTGAVERSRRLTIRIDRHQRIHMGAHAHRRARITPIRGQIQPAIQQILEMIETRSAGRALIVAGDTNMDEEDESELQDLSVGAVAVRFVLSFRAIARMSPVMLVNVELEMATLSAIVLRYTVRKWKLWFTSRSRTSQFATRKR